MGQNVCAEITPLSSACDLGQCIETVHGLPADGMSPTDTWIVQFHPNTKYNWSRGSMEIKTAFVKVNVKPKAMSDANPELEIYRDFIRPLMDGCVSPNFIRHLAGGVACTWRDMMNMLVSLGKDRDRKLARSVMFMRGRERGKWRPAIDTPISKADMQSQILDDIQDWSETQAKFSLIVNEAVPHGAVTLRTWLAERKQAADEFEILFQLLTAVAAMRAARIRHGDLHAGNVWLLPINAPLLYYYYGELYAWNSKWRIAVYDFDLASYTRNDRDLDHDLTTVIHDVALESGVPHDLLRLLKETAPDIALMLHHVWVAGKSIGAFNPPTFDVNQQDLTRNIAVLQQGVVSSEGKVVVVDENEVLRLQSEGFRRLQLEDDVVLKSKRSRGFVKQNQRSRSPIDNSRQQQRSRSPRSV